MRFIESVHNPYIQFLSQLADDPTFRKEKNLLLIEGKKLVKEILEIYPHCPVISIDPPDFYHTEWIQVTPKIIKKLARTEHSEGIFAVIEKPAAQSLKGLRKLLVLDKVTDPGNLGTLLRTALALHWDGVYFLPECCDPFNSKVLRASKGALFQLPYSIGSWEDLKKLIALDEYGVYCADLEGDLPESIHQENILLVLGNEGQGVSSKTLEHSKPISIPIDPKMESLNVAIAGAILMYVLRSP